MNTQTHFDTQYDTFCEIVAEPTNLSGAGNFTIQEVHQVFFEKHGIIPTMPQIISFQEMYLKELEHNSKKLMYA